MTAEEYKTRGNQAFSAGQFEDAIKYFTQAAELDPTNHVLYSNRSASYASLKQYEKALEDAEKTVQLKPDWPRGYSRKGAALHGLGELDQAADAYRAGLQVDPNNAALKRSLDEVEAATAANPFGNIFGPEGLARIAKNPKTAHLLSQPDIIQIINQIQTNPSAINMYMRDPRVMTLMMAAMGVDATVATNAEDAAAAAQAAQAQFDENPSPPKEEQRKPAASKPAEPEPELTGEEAEQKKKRADSDKEKDLGNAAYKARKFDEALQHYDKAFELDDTNLPVLTNKAAALYEAGRFDECIKVCEQAVDAGRDMRADYKVIAKALGRMANAYLKKDDLDNAIKYYQKSLTEHRTPDILNKLKEAERLRAVREKEAYRNPQLAEEAREKGNELFKQSNYAESVKFYTEAIKRNDADPRNYSNRAAAYIKLMALPEAEKDCDAALKLDENFVKAYIRKAGILHAKRDYMKALDMLQTASDKDTEGKHAVEIQQQQAKCYMGLNAVQNAGNREELLQTAMADPEVQRIMGDPVMQSILKQMQEDPRAIQDHMKNPSVAAKIRTLVNAGIIQMGGPR
ncbi:hypothetical protein BC832DRAFT_553737 [Gaertneriomyces semiglobifer]|nr:hypothetical protein BC832DRAFT_553737 [Gaertneriomyces semiglobifer]